MPQFSEFDRRGYRTLDVRAGYGQWVSTYERTVEDAMDLSLLESLEQPVWRTIATAADLGCGTGRTGAWLRRRGVGRVDGVDITPEMLAVARSKDFYRQLVEADITSTGLESGSYDLIAVCLVDEHLPELSPLYREAFRLAKPRALLVLVGFHPHFIMTSGMPTHFTNDKGESLAIVTHVHLLSEHVTAALQAGWSLAEMKEQLIDDRWLALKPKWEAFRHQPIAFAFVWRRSAQ